jgi:hypothetical protein
MNKVNVWEWVRLQTDRLAAWACVAIGGLCLLLGWIGLSARAYPAEQIPYILSGGIGGIFFLGLGAVLWLSADLRDEWRKLDVLEEVLLYGRENGANGPSGATDLRDLGGTGDVLVAGRREGRP